MKREAIIEMTQQHTLYDLLNTAFAQMETDEFVDAIASYLFEREHSDAVMAIWRKDYADNDLPFPPTPSDQRACEAPVQPVVGHLVCESCFDEPNPPDQGAAPAPLHPVVGCEPENGG